MACQLWQSERAEMVPALPGLPELISFLDALPEPRIVLDHEYRIVAANRAYVREFGGGESVLGRRCFEVSHRSAVPCDQAGESCPLKSSRDSGDAERVLHLHHTPRGKEHVDVELAPIRDKSGRVAYFVETLRTVRQASGRAATTGLVGQSPAFNRMLERLMRVAASEAAVLLLGETGTGKELAARLVHEASGRAHGPFVAVDCSGLTDTLFESELFGYEKGAFTGANCRRTGLVEAAAGGTLFLDEVGDIPLSLQVKLLRLLETGSYRRVGSVESLHANFRLVCATHRDLPAMVRTETFRRDLYHRINTFPVRVPSLAERGDDIPLLAESLLERVAGRRAQHFSPAAIAHLQSRCYEGNIRELRNLVERASLMADGSEIAVDDLTDGMSLTGTAAAIPLSDVVTLDEAQRCYLKWAAARHAGDRKSLAARLGISERTLFRKLVEAGLARR
jgi:DNA-binding NtrC family response regulator